MIHIRISGLKKGKYTGNRDFKRLTSGLTVFKIAWLWRGYLATINNVLLTLRFFTLVIFASLN